MKKSSFGIRMATLVGACVLLSQGATLAQAPIAMTKPVQASKANLGPGRMHSSPTFAVDPTIPSE